MAKIKLEFTTANTRALLLADAFLKSEIDYLNPEQEGTTVLILHENIEKSDLDSEQVALQPFVHALKRIIFPTTAFSIQYVNQSTTQLKLGLLHDYEILIKSSICNS